MSRQAPVVEALVRQAFGLLLEIRGRREADRLLALAVTFLKMLQQDGDTETPPMVISVQAVRIREL